MIRGGNWDLSKSQTPWSCRERERDVGGHISQWFHACSVVGDQSTTTLTLWHERAHALTEGGVMGLHRGVTGLAMLQLPQPPWSRPLILWPPCSSMSDTTWYLRYVDMLVLPPCSPSPLFLSTLDRRLLNKPGWVSCTAHEKVMRWSRKRPFFKKNDSPPRFAPGLTRASSISTCLRRYPF